MSLTGGSENRGDAANRLGSRPTNHLEENEVSALFCDLHPSLDLTRAKIEAHRCYYCFDAPCIQACPTQIDIPSFIRKISNGNIQGAATDILSANILGGTCARACPVEVLCQAACVREHSEGKSVAIGMLQRFATDDVIDHKKVIFVRSPSNGLRVAVVGGGPAGLANAHALSLLGYEVTIFEAKEKLGGLNEFGLAPYKMTDDFAQREIDFILSIGGIEVKLGQRLGRDFTLEELRNNFASTFMSIGLGVPQKLGIPGENLPQVVDAVHFIERVRQASNLKELSVGNRVLVIGGGNTAIDVAIQAKRLGAEFVTLVYRRGVEQMSATHYEQDLARKQGVMIRMWAKPIEIRSSLAESSEASLEGRADLVVRFERTDSSFKQNLAEQIFDDRFFELEADQVFKAIGQKLDLHYIKSDSESLKIVNCKIEVNENFETSIPGVYAGGDCINLGNDLTVTAVQQGKLAAQAMHRMLEGKNHGRSKLQLRGSEVSESFLAGLSSPDR